MNKEQVFSNIEEKIRNEEISTKEELIEHLIGLKDRGILTKGQIDSKIEELSAKINCGVTSGKTGTRTPKTMEYAYSNVSAGFGKTGILVLMALAVPVFIAMINLLNK